MIRRSAILTALLALAACITPRPDPALQAQRDLIGMPKELLLSCGGVPARTAVVDNREWFTYRSEAIHSYPATPYGGYYRRPWDYDPPEVASVSCEATFTLRGGRVERLDYTSPQGVIGNPQCGAIVANCLALVPPQSVPPQSVIVRPGPGSAPPPGPSSPAPLRP